MLTVVGISGAKQAGKDTVAARLQVRWGFERVGMADALKHEVATRLHRTILAYLLESAHRGAATLAVSPAEAVRRAIDQKTPMIRALLQEYGTEVRRADDPDYWTRRWIDHVTQRNAGAGVERFVVPDVRFLNEVRAIRECPGQAFVLRVVRPSEAASPADPHQSEHDLDGFRAWDHVFLNSRTTADLAAEVDHWAEAAVGEP